MADVTNAETPAPVRGSSCGRPGRSDRRAARRNVRLSHTTVLVAALFLGQLVALVVGFIAVAKHWDDLDDLGRRAARRFPLRSTLTSIADAVPDGVRDGALGKTRDSSHLQGLLVALAALLILIAAGSWVVSRWQGGATRAYVGGQTDDVVRRGGLAASVVVALVVAGARVLGHRPAEDRQGADTRRPGLPGHARRPFGHGAHQSPHQGPLRAGGDRRRHARRRRGRRRHGPRRPRRRLGLPHHGYRHGRKDCTASTTPAGDLTEVRVSCAPSGIPLSRSSR